MVKKKKRPGRDAVFGEGGVKERQNCRTGGKKKIRGNNKNRVWVERPTTQP